MGDLSTIVQTSIALGDSVFVLAQGQDYEGIKRRFLAAIRAGGDFVDFVIVGNRNVSALVTGNDRVVFTVQTVQLDERDTGDTDYPYGGFYDTAF